MRKVHYRGQYGIGLVWKGIHKKGLDFETTNAFMYEKTDFMGETTGFETIRNSTRLKAKYDLLEDRLHLKHAIFIQPSIMDNNMRWRTNVELFVPVSSYINFTLRWKHSYESVVALERQRHDDRWAVGLTYMND